MPEHRGVRVHQETIEVMTQGPGLYDATALVKACVRRSGVATGVASVFIQHTSASLVIQENADPSVLRDLSSWMDELAPESRHWEHDDEGPDDMPAHARSAVTRTSETIPIVSSELGLGMWQALYVWEHRRAAHARRIVVTVWGAA